MLARFQSFLTVFVEKTGKQWSCPSPVSCYCSNCEQSLPGGSASRWSRGMRLLWPWTHDHKLSSGRGWGPWRRPGASCAWIKQLLPAGLSSPVALVLITSLPILWVGTIHLLLDWTFQNLCEEYIVKFKDCWNYHLLLREWRLKLLEKNEVKIVYSEWK